MPTPQKKHSKTQVHFYYMLSIYRKKNCQNVLSVSLLKTTTMPLISLNVQPKCDDYHYKTTLQPAQSVNHTAD